MSIDEINGRHVGKNYSTDDGDTLVIGGKLVIEEGAEVEGLNSGDGGTMPIASTSALGGVKVGSGLEISADGTLSSATASTTQAGVMRQVEYQSAFTATSLMELETSLNTFVEKLIAAGIMASE